MAFAVGIALEKKGIVIPAVLTVIMTAGLGMFLRELARRRQRISISDRLLFLAPLFLVTGFGCMRAARISYESKAAVFSQCMSEGRELLAMGKAEQLSLTEQGLSFELKNARVASFASEETEYQRAGNLLVYCSLEPDETEPVKEGQEIFLFGKGMEYVPAENPGQFDAKAFYFSKNITGAVNASRIDTLQTSYHRLNQALFLAKKQLQKSFSEYLGEGAGVISSMLLGERAYLSEETENLYRRGGISHILAISGLHVSLFGTAVYAALRKSILGRNGAIPVACAAVLVYGSFVNAGTSTKRAVIMFLLMLLAAVLGRTYDTLSAMSVSMLLILLQSPGALFTASFQLSFAAAYAASVFAGVLGEKEKAEQRTEWEKEKKRRCRWLAGVKGAVRFGLAITLVTLPLTAVHFFEFPLYGILINPVVVPLMTLLLFCALCSGCLGILIPAAGVFFAGGARAILWLYEMLCRGVTKLPFSVLLLGKPKLWQVVLYYVLLAAGVILWKRERYERLRMKKRTGEYPAFRGRLYHGIFVLLPFCLLPFSIPGLEVSFLSVGQGDGIVLSESSGFFGRQSVCLVDGGSSSVSGVGEKRILPFLKAKGIWKIDCVFVSHMDEDHVSGIKEILSQMPDTEKKGLKASPWYNGNVRINRMVLPELSGWESEFQSLIKLAEEKGVEILLTAAGDRVLTEGKLWFYCLSPESDREYDDRNSASMVLLAEYGDFDLLLTGDATKETEEKLISVWQNTPELCKREVEVLKVAHHGSSTSTSEQFLKVLSPEFAVISCGRNNRYGHPHRETMENLEKAGIRVRRTDEEGCIILNITTISYWKNN